MDRIFHKAGSFALGNGSGWNEKTLQTIIEKDPSILGLGKLTLIGKERIQPSRGRLDLLFEDALGATRYVVEIQLGPADPSHIIRTIEYWDFERSRGGNQTFKYMAVLVAEKVTIGRYFNVLSLLGKHLPLVVIEMAGVTVGDKSSLIFTTILTPIEFPNNEPADREYWQQKVGNKALAPIDQMMSLVKESLPNAELQFMKTKIAITFDGDPIIKFRPANNHLRSFWYLPEDSNLEEKMDAAGIDYEEYDFQRDRYELRFRVGDVEKHKELLKELINQIRENLKLLDAASFDRSE